MSLEAFAVTKQFGAQRVLDQVGMRVASGELVALLGPSGSGKTTLLRILAGLESADSGEVHFHGTEVTGESAHVRRAGFVFQHYALFQHLSVFENIAFGLRVRPRRERPSEGEIRRRVMDLLGRVKLAEYHRYFPAQLSGGQRQRVALARALAVEPRVLLLDEPFGALDAQVRKELRRWLRAFHDSTRLTTLFVTHDQEEAFDLADRVVILRDGKVAQSGTPGEIRGAPADAFVADFLGINI
ncbi:MAG: ATP-binding cassette domain-containing protein [Spirochaetes bacterium]|nr:ATP-binding cassette domain-containing protein [Spirochaetota bacterium]